MADDDLLVLESSWPGTTIQGDPGIVSGHMSVSADPDGSVLLSLAVGPAGAGAAECDYVEFILSPAQADALARAIADRPRRG